MTNSEIQIRFIEITIYFYRDVDIFNRDNDLIIRDLVLINRDNDIIIRDLDITVSFSRDNDIFFIEISIY